MSGHPPPHRWADAFAGKLDDAEREELDRHAASCKKCARVRERITRASDSFLTIRNQSSPELPWDSVRARVHWSVSTEKREKREQEKRARKRPTAGWIAFGVTAAAAVVTTVIVDPPATTRVVGAPPIARGGSATPDTPSRATPAAEVRGVVGLVNRATGDVMIGGIRVASTKELFARKLVAGDVIATGDGRLDVQFGEASAFAVGPRSMLELRRFDDHAIELVVEGTLDIQVAPRTNGQTFTVLAGERTIEVRGTQFRVRHDSKSTTVACRHGLVAVRDHESQLEVGAARQVELAADKPVADVHARPLSMDGVNALAEATPLTLPLWNLDTLVASSAPLEIATAGHREVRVDGIELGAAPMRIRVMPGRHTVEAADSAGRYRRAGWIDVSVPSASTPAARLDVLPEPPPTRGIDERRRQLRAGIDKGRLEQCMRTIAKQGLATGTYVQIDIAVDAEGSVNWLNLIDTDLGSSTASCITEVLKDVRFKPGPAASWKERIDL
ncbi:MAG TPA: FecR family protein [Kofleriaceae bacterium]|nr:FecR family protein [Kofleriaceae bacterium]